MFEAFILNLHGLFQVLKHHRENQLTSFDKQLKIRDKRIAMAFILHTIPILYAQFGANLVCFETRLPPPPKKIELIPPF